MMRLIPLAWRNYVRNFGRYKVLIFAISLAVAAMIIVTGILSGFTRTVEDKARRYFAGDIAIQFFPLNGSRSEIVDTQIVREVFSELNSEIDGYALRSVYYRSDSRLFYNGEYARQRRLIGVDWQLEHEFLKGLSLVSGSVPEGIDRQSILLSQISAKKLNAAVGDQVVLSLSTDTGQSNTVSLVVAGIFDESSFFGYAAYLDWQTLNFAMNVSSDRINEAGVYLRNGISTTRVIREIEAYLSNNHDDVRVLNSRSERDVAQWHINDSIGRYAILTMEAQLAEITDLISALGLTAVLIIGLFLGILVTGVTNTYSMIVYERTKEIGTMRAIGMTQSGTVQLIMGEAFFLGVTSSLLGFFTGVCILFLLGNGVQLEFAGVSSLFLKNGYIAWYLPPGRTSLMLGIAVLASLTGAFTPARHASSVHPVEAIRQE